jgi:selenocysteine lyase/cysteine desulfurase
LGAITTVPELSLIAHEAGARVCVDGVAFAAHRAVDVRAWDVDYYVFSWYKVFGPHHAVLYAKQALLGELANINHEFLGPDIGLYKLQPGKYNYELTFALLGVVDYLRELGTAVAEVPAAGLHGQVQQAFEAIAAHEEALAAPLLDWLLSRPGLRLLGPSSASRQHRVPTFSFAVQGKAASELPPLLDRHGIGVRHGHFYSKRLIDRLGLADQGGVVRVSMAHYNTVAEVQNLVLRLDAALQA